MNGSGAPLVSVILPTRDRLPLLREAVASVRGQTLPDWELLVVDAASRDGTAAYLASLEEPRIRVLAGGREENPARLRNRALAEARGAWAAFLDSDDLWEPGKLERHVEAVGARPRARWSYSAIARIDADGAPLSPEGIQPWRPCSGWILRELLTLEALVATPAVVVETELVRSSGGFDPALPYCEDYDLWFRLGERSEAVALPQPLARVRVHPGSYSRNRAGVHGAWVRVYRKAAERLSDPALAALCRARARDHALTRAALLAERGERWEALKGAAGVLGRRPGSLRAWRVLVEGALLGRPAER